MKTRKLGSLNVTSLGARLHGHVLRYGPADEAESLRVAASLCRARRQLPRHRRKSTAPTKTKNCSDASARDGPLQARHRHEVWLFASARRATMAWTALQANAGRACDESLKRLGIDVIDLFYQHRVDPRRADRGHGGRHGRTGESRQGPGDRTFRSERGDAAPRGRGPPHRGAAERVFAVDARRGGKWRAGGLPRTGHRVGGLQPAGARLPDRHDLEDLRSRCRRLPPDQLSAFWRRSVADESQAGRRCESAGPATSTAPPPNWLSPGCWRKATTSSRSPAPSGSSTSRTIWAPRKSCSRPRTRSRSAKELSAIPITGERYQPAMMKLVNG